MVTYSLRCVCGGRTATLIPQTIRWLCGFYTNRTATSRFLARRRVIASLAIFLTWHKTLFQKPQPHRKCIVGLSYGCRTVYARWHMVFTLFRVPRKSHGGLTASLQKPYSDLTAAVRRTAVRVSYGRPRTPCGHPMVFDLMNHTITVQSP